MKMFRVALYGFLGGLTTTWTATGTGGFGWWWLSGILMAASFAPVALFGPRTILGQFRVILPVFMLVTVLCLWSEALIFAPDYRQHAVRNLVAPMMLYVVLAIALAILAVILKLPRADGAQAEMRSFSKLVLLIPVCGLAYALYYLVFGAITFQFFTKGYYLDAVAQVERLGLWFWPIQIARGILMTLAVLPVIRTLRMSRLHTAIVVAAMLWVTGGLAPLVLPNPLMVPAQRFIHTIEIFTQNTSLGVTAVLLLRMGQKRAVGVVHNAPVAT